MLLVAWIQRTVPTLSCRVKYEQGARRPAYLHHLSRSDENLKSLKSMQMDTLLTLQIATYDAANYEN